MDYDDIVGLFDRYSREECIERIEGAGYTHLGSGSSRDVFELPERGRVVKVSPGNIYQNRNEVTTWEAAPDDLRPALLPVVEYDSEYRWVVMPKAERVPYAPEHIREIRDTIRNSDWGCKDVNPENIGRYQGELVLMDYGQGCGPSGLGEPY